MTVSIEEMCRKNFKASGKASKNLAKVIADGNGKSGDATTVAVFDLAAAAWATCLVLDRIRQLMEPLSDLGLFQDGEMN